MKPQDLKSLGLIITNQSEGTAEGFALKNGPG